MTKVSSHNKKRTSPVLEALHGLNASFSALMANVGWVAVCLMTTSIGFCAFDTASRRRSADVFVADVE